MAIIICAVFCYKTGKMKTYSIIRDGEYKNLNTLTVDGAILDLGGNLNSEYHRMIKGQHTFTTANISAQYGCDLVFDIQDVFPIGDAKFDAVLCMNVLEHVYDFNNVISETFRVLKKGGRFICAVPFMHHIHASPDDYFRYTRSAIEEMLKENKFENIDIREIGLGLFSLFYQSSSGAFPSYVKGMGKNLARALDWLLSRFSQRYRNVSKRIPLGYFVMAGKV